jgi:hypothetical protein
MAAGFLRFCRSEIIGSGSWYVVDTKKAPQIRPAPAGRHFSRSWTSNFTPRWFFVICSIRFRGSYCLCWYRFSCGSPESEHFVKIAGWDCRYFSSAAASSFFTVPTHWRNSHRYRDVPCSNVHWLAIIRSTVCIRSLSKERIHQFDCRLSRYQCFSPGSLRYYYTANATTTERQYKTGRGSCFDASLLSATRQATIPTLMRWIGVGMPGRSMWWSG